MIHVIATIQLAAGRREEFLTEFRALVPLVQAEQGCLEYGPTVNVPTNLSAQGEVRNDVVTVVEKWEDLSALEAHLVAPHMLTYRAKVKPLVVETKIQVLCPA